MPMTMRPPVKASRAWRSSQGGLGAVEVVRLVVEVLDRLGHDARAGREHQLVVAQALAVGQVDGLGRLVDPLDFDPTTRLDPRVEQAPLRTLEMLGALAAHGDVHEAGLIDVTARSRRRR